MHDKDRIQTAQQKLSNFMRSVMRKEYAFLANDIAVLHALASYFYYKETCNPSIAALQIYAGLSKKQVMRSITSLENLKLIKAERQDGVKTIYHWCIPVVTDEEIYRKNNKQLVPPMVPVPPVGPVPPMAPPTGATHGTGSLKPVPPVALHNMNKLVNSKNEKHARTRASSLSDHFKSKSNFNKNTGANPVSNVENQSTSYKPYNHERTKKDGDAAKEALTEIRKKLPKVQKPFRKREVKNENFESTKV